MISFSSLQKQPQKRFRTLFQKFFVVVTRPQPWARRVGVLCIRLEFIFFLFSLFYFRPQATARRFERRLIENARTFGIPNLLKVYLYLVGDTKVIIKGGFFLYITSNCWAVLQHFGQTLRLIFSFHCMSYHVTHYLRWFFRKNTHENFRKTQW